MTDYIFDQKPELEDLVHYGVMGMKWGVRNDGPNGVSRKVNKEASKDAAEYARAKAFYGKGAGTRRKLIKQTVDAKAKRLPGYKKAFDHHLDRQDGSKHASKAVTERKRKDRSEKAKQQTSYLARRFTGEQGTQAAFAAAIIAGGAYLRSQKGQAKMKQASAKIKDVVNNQRQSQSADWIADYIKRNT